MIEEAWSGGWDDVVVGAGSAGAALAARLSENPDRRVLLLEAGARRLDPDVAGGPLGSPVFASHNWDYSAFLGEAGEGARTYPYQVGKVLGGSSAVNGAIALRGLPADFDRWAAAGNPSWAWDQVLPYFVRLETDVGGNGAGHGRDGPIPIHRPTPSEFDRPATAFQAACNALGLPDLPDLNGSGGIGVGPLPSNARDGRRVSTADAYLEPVMERPNLTVWEGCEVTRVLWRGRRAVGVELLVDGRPEQVSAGAVALCAGAVSTPAILERSGIGAADDLRKLGIRTVADLPGVGENLSEHAVVAMWALAKPGVCRQGRPWHQVAARAAGPGGEPDLGLFLASNIADTPVPVIGDLMRGRMGIAVSAMLLAPDSRGTVKLVDAAPDSRPEIVLRLASEPSDVRRLMVGAQLAWSVLRSPPFAELLSRVLVWTERMLSDDAVLRRAVATFASPMWHPAGTARMGAASDGMSVVDERCQVHSVTGLRVVDASVMPTICSAPTNLTCIMLGERVAEWMG